MSKKLFIAAIEKDSGKTTTSLSLMHLALKKYHRVGYIKPFGGQSVAFRGRRVDKDVALMVKVFGLTGDLTHMSPIVLDHDTTHNVVDGLISPQELRQRIMHACNELEKSCDFIIIEGSGHPGVGSVMQISNAQIAHMLDAPVLLVTGGGLGNVVDRLALILALFEKEQVDLRAVLVNRLIPDKRERSLDYLRRSLKNEALTVIGGYDYHPILASPTLQRISDLLKLPLQGNHRARHRIIFKVLVAAASTHRFIELLTEPSLIIITSSRDELLVTLVHLYKMPQYRSMIVGLVISGAVPVSPITQQILDKSRIPYMRATNQITAELYQAINRDVAKINANDREKLELIFSLADQTFDFDAIDTLFSV